MSNERKKRSVAPIYLIAGPEQYMIDDAIQQIQKKIGIDATDTIEYDLERTPVEAVIEEADTLPFFESHKCIVARHAHFLKAPERGKETVEHHLDAVYPYLENPSPTAVVIFTAPYEKLDGRKKITKWMKKYATVIEAKPLEGAQLTKWMQEEAKKQQLQISSELIEYLIHRVGEDLLQLSTEMKKIATYAAGEPVTKQMIDTLVVQTPEMNVFALTDAYVKGDTEQALSIYHDLLANGNEPIALNALIAGQIRLMLHVITLNQKGFERYQIAKLLKVHHYRVKLVLDNRHLPEPVRLMQILHRLATIDYRLKTTSIKREHLLDFFFAESIQA